MATSEFARLPGFRDFPPEDFALRAHIQTAWRRVSRRYGFSQYDGPPLESLDLYVEKSGEEIVHQLYTFVDKGGREVALRPEMTPSLARILGDRSRGMSKPIRWFSVPQLFRYERQQRGRLREHFQWNVDIVGEAGVAADAEVLAVAIDGLRELGLTSADFAARVSDRRLLTALLLGVGIERERVPVAFSVIDKIERMPEAKADELLRDEVGLGQSGIASVRRLLEASDLADLGSVAGGDEGVAEELERLREYAAILGSMGLGEYLRLDLKIVRGLAYYTGIVFELFDRQGELRAICGGGRYDRLLELVGGEPLPAVGFGMGDVVLGELLDERGLVPPYEPGIDYFMVAVTEGERETLLRIAHRLREKGHSVAYGLRDQSVGRQMKDASREGARTALILGPEEMERGTVVARDLETGEESTMAIGELEG
ncbi:MAG: histidine--tRNA ligase [Longimicrobiales bacterium]|nr:histidine--tRNA ligase [Longimicrobiales bacterium]